MKMSMSEVHKLTAGLPDCERWRSGQTEQSRPPQGTFDLLNVMTALFMRSQQIGEVLSPRQAEETDAAAAPGPQDQQVYDPLAHVDAEALRQLTDMGFAEGRAAKALVLCDMSVGAAMEWLLTHESDAEADTPISAPPARTSRAGSTFRPDPVWRRTRRKKEERRRKKNRVHSSFFSPFFF